MNLYSFLYTMCYATICYAHSQDFLNCMRYSKDSITKQFNNFDLSICSSLTLLNYCTLLLNLCCISYRLYITMAIIRRVTVPATFRSADSTAQYLSHVLSNNQRENQVNTTYQLCCHKYYVFIEHPYGCNFFV